MMDRRSLLPLSSISSPNSLDPSDWGALRQQGHRMLDDMFDHLESLRDRPVWKSAPGATKQCFQSDLPWKARNLQEVHADFLTHILPYVVGNAHPGFMGWVHGGGTAVGMLADMLASGMNTNAGGRNQVAVLVERQITAWMRQLFSFPESASGLMVTGSSMANLIGILVARQKKLGSSIREQGIGTEGARLTAYTSAAAHGCIAKAMEIAGLGRKNLRLIPTDSYHRIDITALRRAIQADRRDNYIPFCLVGNAGTVDVGAVDDLVPLANIAKQEEMWYHIDGAYGALGLLSPKIADQFDGIQLSDSIALDFHKWGQVPYDAGFILVRDGDLHFNAFASAASYLQRTESGLSGGSPWPCDFGPELSRGFRSLKTWYTFQTYGAEQLGSIISQTCDLAQYLRRRIDQHQELELLAPVSLNIVCFRYQGNVSEQELNDLNSRLVVQLQESGLCAPSTTTLNGKIAIRAAIFNHRTTPTDIDCLVETTLRLAKSLSLATTNQK